MQTRCAQKDTTYHQIHMQHQFHFIVQVKVVLWYLWTAIEILKAMSPKYLIMV